MPHENDDETRKPTQIKPNIRLVEDNTKSKPKRKKLKYSKEQKRLAGLLFYLHTCRSLIDGFESAARSFSRALPKIEYLAKRVDPRELSDEARSQVNIVTVLNRDVNERMQTVADFRGSGAEIIVLMKRESEHICGAARRLKSGR